MICYLKLEFIFLHASSAKDIVKVTLFCVIFKEFAIYIDVLHENEMSSMPFSSPAFSESEKEKWTRWEIRSALTSGFSHAYVFPLDRTACHEEVEKRHRWMAMEEEKLDRYVCVRSKMRQVEVARERKTRKLCPHSALALIYSLTDWKQFLSIYNQVSRMFSSSANVISSGVRMISFERDDGKRMFKNGIDSMQLGLTHSHHQ